MPLLSPPACHVFSSLLSILVRVAVNHLHTLSLTGSVRGCGQSESGVRLYPGGLVSAYKATYHHSELSYMLTAAKVATPA